MLIPFLKYIFYIIKLIESKFIIWEVFLYWSRLKNKNKIKTNEVFKKKVEIIILNSNKLSNFDEPKPI